MHDMYGVDVDAPAVPAGTDGYQYDAVLIVSEDGMGLNPDRSLRDLEDLAEEAENDVPTAIFARDLIPPGFMPLQLLGEQVVEGSHIAFGEGGVPVSDASDIRMLGHW